MQLVVLCFGSLGCVKSDVWKGLRNFSQSKENIKNVIWRKLYLEELS